MIDASRDAGRDGARFLLEDNIAENAAIAAHYLLMVPQYRDLRNRAGMRYNLKCAAACFKAALRSLAELDALDATVREAAE